MHHKGSARLLVRDRLFYLILGGSNSADNQGEILCVFYATQCEALLPGKSIFKVLMSIKNTPTEEKNLVNGPPTFDGYIN